MTSGIPPARPGRPPLFLSGVVLDAPDPLALAGFYQRLLGWPLTQQEEGWAKLVPDGGGTGISFQAEPSYTPPVWPAEPGAQQMQTHLDFQVDDLAAAEAHALSCGARLAAYQPQDDVRVLIDPVGHPFCVFL
ncbi:VOC family protein [Streptomyces sp. SID11385]|uniref:VOC family protein n=1 Tax=Streptomyces sp. SID11385 TaxID=2706031 RepID=UPI0013C586D6|nr:VOC family protein [Streptomyces sp. SID11385]NEA41293.1 VOC family protein [Streptomyces sp. SID11385]